MLSDYLALAKNVPSYFDNQDAIFTIILDVNQIQSWQLEKRQALLKAGHPECWADIGIIVDDPYVLILRDLVEDSNGRRFGYLRMINRASLDKGPAVVILPVMKKEVVLLRQYRHATRSWHLEIPRGFGEADVSADENARKEIREEINGEVQSMVELGMMHSNSGIEGQPVMLYFADLSSLGSPQQSEGIERVQMVTVKEFEELIRDGTLTDGFTITAFARARLRGMV